MKMTRDILKLLAAIRRAAKFPDNFTAAEREAMVDLLMVCLEMPEAWIQIRAAEAAIAMEGVNIQIEHQSGHVSRTDAWATH